MPLLMSVSVPIGFDRLFFSCTSACLEIFVKWGRTEYQTLWILPCQVPQFCIPIKLELCSGMQLIYLETVWSFLDFKIYCVGSEYFLARFYYWGKIFCSIPNVPSIIQFFTVADANRHYSLSCESSNVVIYLLLLLLIILDMSS